MDGVKGDTSFSEKPTSCSDLSSVNLNVQLQTPTLHSFLD